MKLEDLVKLPMDVDVMIDMSNQPNPDAHKERRYVAGIAYGRATEGQENYLIFMVKADVSVGDDGAIIHSIDEDKNARAIYMKGIDGYAWADKYTAQMATQQLAALPQLRRDAIDALFAEHAPISDTLPAHRVHYVNADMTNPDHRPHKDTTL